VLNRGRDAPAVAHHSQQERRNLDVPAPARVAEEAGNAQAIVVASAKVPRLVLGYLRGGGMVAGSPCAGPVKRAAVSGSLVTGGRRPVEHTRVERLYPGAEKREPGDEAELQDISCFGSHLVWLHPAKVHRTSQETPSRPLRAYDPAQPVSTGKPSAHFCTRKQRAAVGHGMGTFTKALSAVTAGAAGSPEQATPLASWARRSLLLRVHVLGLDELALDAGQADGRDGEPVGGREPLDVALVHLRQIDDELAVAPVKRHDGEPRPVV
jgi:hypothetical protein